MIKKHQKRYKNETCKITSLNQLLKEAFSTTKEDPDNEENLFLMLFSYWPNQMEKLIAAVQIFLLTLTEKVAMNV